MNERRARHLLPRPCGVKPHPFTPPLSPPTPLASFQRRQESRGAVSGRGTPTTNPCRFPDFPPLVVPVNPVTQRGRSPSRHSREASNPDGPSPLASFLRRQESRGAGQGGWPPTPVIPAKPVSQRGRPHSRHSCEGRNPEGRIRGGPPHSRDSRAEPAPHSDTGQEPRGARLEQGRPYTDRLEMPAPSYRRSRTCWDLHSTACCSRRPHSCPRKR